MKRLSQTIELELELQKTSRPSIVEMKLNLENENQVGKFFPPQKRLSNINFLVLKGQTDSRMSESGLSDDATVKSISKMTIG